MKAHSATNNVHVNYSMSIRVISVFMRNSYLPVGNSGLVIEGMPS